MLTNFGGLQVVCSQLGGFVNRTHEKLEGKANPVWSVIFIVSGFKLFSISESVLVLTRCGQLLRRLADLVRLLALGCQRSGQRSCYSRHTRPRALQIRSREKPAKKILDRSCRSTSIFKGLFGRA